MASTPSRRYPYLPLDPKNTEIRLLTLTYPFSLASPTPNNLGTNNPAGTPSQFTLALHHASLSTAPPPEFSALSYVWGSPTDTLPVSIIVPDPTPDPGPARHNHNPNLPLNSTTIIEVQITRNLHTALTRLAAQYFTGHIWIDALCINQADTAEKNSQVPLMSRIYRQAEQVVVWLGPNLEPGTGPGSGAGGTGAGGGVRGKVGETRGGVDGGGMLAVRELGALFREGVWEYFEKGESQEGKGEREKNERIRAFVQTMLQWAVTAENPSDNTGKPRVGFDFEAIWRVFRQRPWWRRVWIIQEVVLARKAVVLCGADPAAPAATVAWEDVRECIRLFEWMVLYPSTEPQHRRLYALLDDLYPSVSHLALASDGYQRTRGRMGKNVDGENAGVPLLEVMIWTSMGNSIDGAIQATDPRDRIYGLLGMVREKDRRRIPVDYSPGMTVNKVLFAVGKVLMHDYGPDMLSFCQRTGPPPSREPLPSWVPDWIAPRMIPLIGGVFWGDGREVQLRGNASNGTLWRDWVGKSGVEDLTDEKPILSLPGVVVGRIEKVGRQFRAAVDAPSYLDGCRDWLLEACRMVEECGGHYRDAMLQEVWRVPIADFGYAKRADNEGSSRFKHGFDVLIGKIPSPAELKSEMAVKDWIKVESWDYRRIWKVYNRRAFVDAAGRPGLGPEGTAIGDRIVIFAGAHVPFILHEETGKPRSRNRVLGPAYACGLMDGEGVPDATMFDEIKLV